MEELRAACEGLVDFPRAFPALSRFPDVHRRLHGNYLIFYRVGIEDILILAVLHGASDYENALADLL